MNKAFNQKGKKSFDEAYPRARFEFRSLTLRASKKKALNNIQKYKDSYHRYIRYIAGNYL